MALTAFCPVCQRTAFLEDPVAASSPVCSTPLLEVAEEASAEISEAGASPQTEGL
jgi:hypothetical protein